MRRSAGRPAQLISIDSIATDKQVPIPFRLAFDAKAIDPTHSYAVRARITDAGGNLRWRSTDHYPVLTQGNPLKADILVRAVGS